MEHSTPVLVRVRESTATATATVSVTVSVLVSEVVPDDAWAVPGIASEVVGAAVGVGEPAAGAGGPACAAVVVGFGVVRAPRKAPLHARQDWWGLGASWHA